MTLISEVNTRKLLPVTEFFIFTVLAIVVTLATVHGSSSLSFVVNLKDLDPSQYVTITGL